MAGTVAEVMVAMLKGSGVRRVYGIPGDSLNGFTDALRKDGGITWEHVRHEEAAGFAAAAEAALTGELAVCAGSCGPGNLHLINGLFDANRSGVPVLAIAAHIPNEEIGGGYFQETHPQQLFRECSVYCELASVPGQVTRVVEMAMRAALQRGGVGVVVIPGELFLAGAPSGAKAVPVRAISAVVRPDDESLAVAAEVLNAAGRVTILAGAGCAGAHDQLIALAAALKAPVVHAFRGKEFVEYDNPYDVGMTGLIGFSSGYRAMEHCDALVMLGTDFPYRQFYPEGVPVIQVDVRGERIGRRVPVQVPLLGTVRDTVDALLPLLDQKADSAHLELMTAHYRRARARLDHLARAGHGGSPLHPQFVAATIDRLAAADTVFTADVGTPCIWAARYLRMNGTRRLIGSFNHGSMANALPQAIGAQASQPGRQVVALSGDGGVAMLLGELLTLRQQSLPVKVVVFNNAALSFVELEMKAAGIVTYGTDLVDPDFSGIARSAGLFGARVEAADDSRQRCRRRSRMTVRHWSTFAPPATSSHFHPRSPTARSRASLSTRRGPSCRGKGTSSSSWPSRTCTIWGSNDPWPRPLTWPPGRFRKAARAFGRRGGDVMPHRHHHGWTKLGSAVVDCAVLAIACLITYLVVTHLLSRLYFVSRADDLLGGMWAVIATIFVNRDSYQQSLAAAASRMAATSVSFVACLIYLLFLPFHAWALAVLIGVSALTVTSLGRPQDAITAAITTAVVMLVAAVSPRHAWQQPILRFADTVIGVAVGIAAAWIGLRVIHPRIEPAG